MQKSLYAVGLLAVIGIGIFFWQSAQNPAYSETASGMGNIGSQDTPDPYDWVIRSTDKGFEPKELSIKQGDRVRFINESSQESWPASAIHPTHSLYPDKDENRCLGSAFDACRGLQYGEFFAFTFNYEGEWRYHDHLDASKTGVIKVD